MASLELRNFHEVWVVDTEYCQLAGERPDVHCLVAQELWSGRVLRLWHDDLARLGRPPYPIGPGALYVSYNALADLGCHLVLGWDMPARVVDLLIEFRCLTNGTGWREGEKSKHKLIHAAQYFDMNPMDGAEKSEMQALALRGKPFTPDERRALLTYCDQDVRVTTELLRRMAPHLTLQALQRGRFARTAARMLHAGIPLDPEWECLQDRRENIIQALIDQVNPAFNVFQGREFKYDRMDVLVASHKLPWPWLPSGHLSLKKGDWERMIERYPFLRPLYQCWRMRLLLRQNSLAVGTDNRNRYGFFPFAADTGRNTWRV